MLMWRNGRRARFRSLWKQFHAGSSPVISTKQNNPNQFKRIVFLLTTYCYDKCGINYERLDEKQHA